MKNPSNFVVVDLKEEEQKKKKKRSGLFSEAEADGAFRNCCLNNSHFDFIHLFYENVDIEHANRWTNSLVGVRYHCFSIRQNVMSYSFLVFSFHLSQLFIQTMIDVSTLR